jgi:hypothetical protein
LQGGVVPLDEEHDAVEFIVCGAESDESGLDGGGDDGVVIVAAEKFGGFVKELAGLAEEEDGMAPGGLAGDGGDGGGAIGFREIGLGEPDLKGGAGALAGLDGDGALVFFGGDAGVVEPEA